MTTKSSDSLHDCVLHYKNNHESKKKDIVELAELAGVNIRTAKKWLSGSNPIGLNRLALTIYLERFGYSIDEISETSKVIRKLGLLLLRGRLDKRVVQEKLGYNRYQSIIDIVLGRHQPSADKVSRIKEINAQFEIPEGYVDEKGDEGRKPRISEQLQKNNSQGEGIKLSPFVKKELETKFVWHANALLALSELFLSNSFSAYDRNELRSKIQSGKGVFNLSNKLNELCSETARKKS